MTSHGSFSTQNVPPCKPGRFIADEHYCLANAAGPYYGIGRLSANLAIKEANRVR